MGKKQSGRDSSLPGYRDDPDALSLNTNPEEQAFLQDADQGPPASSSSSARYADDLPSYEASEAIETVSRENEVRAGAVRNLEDRYAIINLPDSQRSTSEFLGKKSTNKEVSARMDPRLSDANEFYKYVNDYLQWAPPKPVVWIAGYHYVTRRSHGHGNKNKSRERVTDFEFMLNLQQYLGHASDPEWRRLHVAGPTDKVLRGSFRSQRAVGVRSDLEVGVDDEHAQKDLRAWCDEYSFNASKLRIFRVSRTVPGIDRESIKDWVETAIRSTNYCGHLDVNLIVEDRAVDIYSDHWANKVRTGWMRYIFYLTFLWIFTWPLLFFMTRRWRVVTVDWPFSLPWPERGQDARKFASVSEREWFSKHENLIKKLAFEKFKGNASQICLDNTGGIGNIGQGGGNNSRPSSTGNQGLDGAVNLFQAGVRGYNVMRNAARGRGDQDWGYDE